MSTIDDKVVAMSFESSKFEQGVNAAIGAIEKLKAALQFPKAGKGLDDINAAAKRVDLSHIGNAVDAIKGKFSALSVAALAVIANIATKAVSAGANFVKAFSLDPVKAGFSEYTTNLNAVQTILANTQASGAKLSDVNEALKQLNDYSDKTIYNFSQMAKNIGTFTAAGVDLDTATASIKGIANLAALSGSNSEQASTAMYQLSQAISAGRVSLQDWNSVVNAGMGGTVFQRALAQTAESMGTLKEGTVKLVGPMKNVSIHGESFRQSLQAGPGKASWLTSDVLTKTLQQFTGDLTDAELKAQGFNDAQIKAIQQTAKTAQHAATEVKTLSGVLDTAKETAGSGWAETWQIIFGDFGEAKTLFTGVSNAVNGFIKSSADARNNVLKDWKALGGRTVLIDAVRIAFHNLGEIVAPIKEAFRDIFPATTGRDLFNLTQRIHDLAEAMKPSPQTVENLHRTFAGLFSVLDIGKQVVQGIFTVLGKLFGAVGGGNGGFLSLTATIGDFLVKLDETLKKSDGIHEFFSKLGDILAVPVEMLGKLANAFVDLFSGISSGGVSGGAGVFESILDAIGNAADKAGEKLRGLKKLFQPFVDAYLSLIQGIGTAIGEAASNMNFDAILQVIKTGLLAGLVVMLKQFLGKGSFVDQLAGITGGLFANIGKSFGSLAGALNSLSGTMGAIQSNIKAKTLKEIAIAIGILAASVVALSFVDPEKLKKSITAITVMFGQLLGAMAVLDKIAASKGFIKLPAIAAAMVLLAGAIDVLAIAVFALGKLDWDELAKGLTGVGALLAGMAVAVKPLSASSGGLIRAGIGITGIAIAMNLLAFAVKQMAALSWQELAKGLTGVAGGLVALTAATSKMPAKGMVTMGLGVIALATGLNILAKAMVKFAGMNWQDIGKGLAGVGGALVVIAGAMHLMPTNMAITAAGLLLVSLALGKIASAVQSMAGMSMTEIAKGLGVLAGSLTILAAALYAMSGTLAGAAALGIAAAGISLLAGALVKLGGMSWGEIIKSLVTLAAAFTVLGVAGALLTPVIPSLLGLGAALVLIGGGLALAGAGVFLVGAGLSAIAVAGPTAVGILIAALLELEQGMIQTAKNLILGLLEIVRALADTAPKFVDALVKIINSLLDVVIKATPKVVEAFQVILDAVLKLLKNNQDKIIQAGFDLIVALLKGIRNNLPAIVTLVVEIITDFVKEIAKNLSKIIDAGGELLLAFIKGITKHIVNIAETVVDIIVKFLEAIANQLPRVVTAGSDIIVNLIQGFSKAEQDVVRAGTSAIIAFIQGIGEAADDVVSAAVDTIITFMNTLVEESLKLVDAGATAIVNFLNGVADAIDQHAPEIRQAGVRVGEALINGLIGGLTARAGELYGKISGIMDHAMSLVHKIPLIGSPSKVTTDVGEFIILGLIKGMDNTAPDLYNTAESVSNNLIDKFKEVFQITSPSKVMHDIGQAVGQGFAEGLKGSQDDIRNAFTDLNNKLTDSMVTARETIKSEQTKLAKERENLAEQQAKLDKLRAEKKPDADAIKRALDDLKETGVRIKEIQDVIKVNEDLLKKTTAGHETLTKALKDEKQELIGLVGEYDRITKKLEDAQKALDDIKQAREEMVASTTAKFGALPALDTTTKEEIANARNAVKEEQKRLAEVRKERTKDIADQRTEIARTEDDLSRMEDQSSETFINATQKLADQKAALNELLDAQGKSAQSVTSQQAAVAKAQSDLAELLKGKTLDSMGNSVDQLATYEDALKHQTSAVGAYNSTLQQLRELGLDDATYKKLVDDGVADAAFAKQLLAGGRDAVKKLNTLDKNLQTVSTRLGTNVGRNLFKAGQDAAQGIVDGLEDKKDSVSKKMKEIGAEMIAALRKSLGMKSPSKEMMEIGTLSIEGLALGFTESTHLLTDAADKVAEDALVAMQKSMRSIHGAVLNELDATPVITPILDLSLIRNQSRELANLIPASSSFGQASIISAQQRAAQTEPSETTLAGTSVRFEQNNYSPEALTEIEIYRQTKNQLSQLKSVLATT